MVDANGSKAPDDPSVWRSFLGLSLVVLLFIGLVQLVAAAALVWWSPGPDPALAAAGLELIGKKNVAISLLENGEDKPKAGGDLDRSAQLFSELAQQLPEERLPVQNQAIARVLFLKNSEQPRTEPARDAMKRLLEVAPNSPEAAWLAAEILVALDKNTIDGPDEVRAMEILKQAADENPNDIVTRYALYEIGSLFLEGTPQQQLAHQSLGEAYRARPGNVRLLLDWLVLQAQQKDEDVLQTIEQARETLAPLRDSLLARERMDVFETLEQAREAIEQDAWPRATGLVMRLRNVTISREEVKRDLAAAKPHPLDFVVFDYSPEFYATYDPPKPEAGPAVPVRFEPFPDTFQLPNELDEVRDVLVTDFNLDGRPDVVVLRENEVVVLGRQEDLNWEILTRQSIPPGAVGVLAADLDYDRILLSADEAPVAEDESENVVPVRQGHDADVDLVVYGKLGARILRNDSVNEDGELVTDVDPAQLQRKLTLMETDSLAELSNVHTGTLIDVDHDADLDLVFAGDGGVTVWLKAGEKEISFRNETQWSILPPADMPITSMFVADVDRDADLDVVVGTSDRQQAGYLDNLRHGRFQWQPYGEGFDSLKGSRSIAVLETDGNASWDLAGAGPQGLSLVQTRNPRGEVFEAIGQVAVDETAADGVLAIDFDNDGFQDLLAYGGAAGLKGFRATGLESFAAVDDLFDTPPPVADLAAGDLDGDGDLDLVTLTQDGEVRIWNNQGGNANKWINLYAIGQSDNKGRAAHSGLGSLVELKHGNRYQAQVVQGLVTHFGLGNVEEPDVLRIVWTNGVPQSVIQPQANQTLAEEMTLKGSCPYLYAWDGEKFVFVTDCLWAAPIGLQFAEGVMAPSREWEYLKIDGDLLKPKDGVYELQLTEELWEAAYFDHVRLIAVDHPPEVEIQTNEKVGPPSIAEPRIHTVRHPRQPVAARDQTGRDVSPWVGRRDGKFLRAFERKIRQGLTEPHYLELDLGPLENPQDIKLYLVGWIYPTDTSLNIAFSQNPELEAPRLPHILVPDASGQWQETVAYMGFPGGKTKTICVDLSDAFLTDDYRLRIQTTAEIYWDAAYFTVDDPEVDVRQTPLELLSADLHYRGFSRKIPYRDNAPEQYVYQDVSTDQAWPPMRGNFTRYGDVRELLDTGDDRMVVMSSGDEVTLRFAAPAAPPPGWTRDFVLHCVGWDKDADLNTVYGQSVEPLPFRGMQSYPFGEREGYPDTEKHRRYLRDFQTRRQAGSAFWKRLVPVWDPRGSESAGE